MSIAGCTHNRPNLRSPVSGLLFALLFLSVSARAEVVVYLPLDQAYTTERTIPVMGMVTAKTSNLAEESVTVTVNSRRTYDFAVRDGYYFAGEIYLEDGANSVVAGKTTLRVFAGDGPEAPPDYRRIYGHVNREDSCDGCHRAGEDDRGNFVLTLLEPPESLCNWCHYQTANPKMQSSTAVVHAPVSEGKCLSCHLPHAGARPGLLRDEPAKVCSSCHAKLYQDLKEKPYIHGPLNVGGCETCHLTHAGPNASLLKEPEKELCARCHGPMLSSPGRESLESHPGIIEGRCHDCHSPHASANPKMMKKIVNNLCIECHPSSSANFHEEKGFSIYICGRCHNIHNPDTAHLIVNESKSLCEQCHQKDLGRGTYAHKALTEKNCFECHGFHQEPIEKRQSAVCFRCHGIDQAFSNAHPVRMSDSARCTGCHSPHRSAAKNFIYPVAHKPFEEQDCASCHGENLDNDRGKLSDESLCFNCHPEKKIPDTKPAGLIIHRPFSREKCRDCHLPHNSEYPFLLSSETQELCGRCHTSVKKAQNLTPASIHADFKEGRCGSCHDSHLGNAKLLKKPLEELCLGCHQKILEGENGAPRFTHPLKKEESCILCHSGHYSRQHGLLKEKESVLCQKCHDRFYKAMNNPVNRFKHEPVAKGACKGCHAIHGSDQPKLVKAKGNALCLLCHANIVRGLHHPYSPDFETYGPPGEEKKMDCLTCHKSHYSPYKGLVIRTDLPICRECHDF